MFASNAYFVWEKTEITVPVYSSLQEFKDDYVLKLYVNGKLSNDYYVEYETNCSTFTTVLTNKVGRYTVYYKAYSKNNNISSEQAIIFNVVDISAPTITLDGNTLTINKGDKITDYHFYTITDDTTNFSEIKIEIDDSNVIYNVLGTYPATIKATDLYNNISKVNFYVKIIDNLPPKFTIIKPLVFSYKEDIKIEEYIKCIDNNDNDITKLVKITGLDTSVLGRKEVIFSVIDYSNNALEFKVMVDVVDDIPPVINLKTPEVVLNIVDFTSYNESYFLDYLYNYSDNYSLKEKINIKVDVSELIEMVMDFNVYFIATDELNNQTVKNLIVKLREFIGPIIEGPDNLNINLGEEVDLLSLISVSDLYDSDVESRLSVDDGGFDFNSVGCYKVKYTCFNTSGIFSEKVITINVISNAVENDIDLTCLIFVVVGVVVVGMVVLFIIIRKRRNH